jgi:hypothetical protein
VTTDEDALRVKCPTCGKGKGEPCVYISAPATTVPYVFLSPKNRALVDRVGTICKRPHNERRNKFHFQRPPPPLPPVHPALVAMRQFDRIEYQDMRTWLRRWAPLLWSTPGPNIYIPCPVCGAPGCVRTHVTAGSYL